MPWTVSKDTSMCPVSKPWAVKKSDTGAKAGCHVSEADAKKQQAALYAQEKKSNMSVDTADNREANGDSRHRLGVRLALDDGSLEYRNDTDDAQPVMHGHFAVFNEWTRINSLFEGEFMERIAPGAFAKTFQERGDKIRVLYQHGRDPSTGAKPLGTPEVLSEDDRGAYYEVSLFDAPYVNELKPALRSGQLGASFKFEVMREDISDSAERSAHNPDGIQERTIKEVRLFEFGPVTFPAYEGATSGLRSITDDYLAQALLEFSEHDPARMRDFLYAQLASDAERLRALIAVDDDTRDTPDFDKSPDDGDTGGHTEGSPTNAPPAHTTPDDNPTDVSTSETGAARSKILTTAKHKEEPWRLLPRGRDLPS